MFADPNETLAPISNSTYTKLNAEIYQWFIKMTASTAPGIADSLQVLIRILDPNYITTAV